MKTGNFCNGPYSKTFNLKLTLIARHNLNYLKPNIKPETRPRTRYKTDIEPDIKPDVKPVYPSPVGSRASGGVFLGFWVPRVL